MKRKLLQIAGGVAVLGVLAVSANFFVNLNREYGQFNEAMSGMKGVKFGESQQELLYAFGPPRYVQKVEHNGKSSTDDDSRLRSPDFDLPPGAKIEDFPIWLWFARGYLLTIEFDLERKTVTRISCLTMDEDVQSSQCQTVGRVQTGKDYQSLSGHYFGSEDYIRKTLGKPDRESFSKVNDLNRKILDYDALGLQLVMTGRQLLSVHKYESYPSFFWWLEHGPSM